MIIVYVEALPFWPFQKSVMSYLPKIFSAVPLWVWPLDWLRVRAPSFSPGSVIKPTTLLENGRFQSTVICLIAPHLLWTLASIVASTLSVLILAPLKSLAYYFNYFETAGPRTVRSWGFYFTLQDELTLRDRAAAGDYTFHCWSNMLLDGLGLGLTRFITTVFWTPVLSGMLVMTATMYMTFEAGNYPETCMAQELTFLYAHVSWWLIVCVGHHARRRNMFVWAHPVRT